jgi:hypothetical protein
MDIELTLREKLVLKDPGPRFTDGVMSRVGDAPVGQNSDSVVQLADERARRRSRRILLATVVAIAAAASIPTYYLSRGPADAPVVQEAVASPSDASPTVDPSLQALMPVEIEPTGDGQSPQECVDPDVLRALLLGPGNQTFQLNDASPPELAAFKAPRQLTWVGASERGTRMSVTGAPMRTSTVSAVYRTSLAPDAARTTAAGALMAGGWKLQSDDRQSGMNVFTSVNSQPVAETYCRDDKPVNILASALDGVTYLVLSISRQTGNASLRNACDQPPQPAVRPASTLDKYMPKLELPRDPATGQPVPTSGGGGSSGDVKRRANASFTLKDSADNIARHFAGQMARQGWNADANWSGAGTAGSTWTMRQDADTVLQSMLVVSAFENDRFTVVLDVVTTK